MTIEGMIENYETTWNDIINNRNIDSINETNFTKEATIIADPENIVGIENFKAYYQNFLTGFSDIKFTIHEAFGQGDKLCKQWSFQGKHTGEFFGIPATGNSVYLEGMTLTKMEDGKIA
ncbi:MAG: ester cyclase [Saprospiraceae bacterium]